ncbi:MAG: DUF3276 family protein [Tannerellaceae bacterium]
MREVARKTKASSDKEIIYSRTVKAGRRIYYLDVKQDKRDELFVSITESKRLDGPDTESHVFEKHKLFIFKEDFGKFHKAMEDIMSFIYESQGPSYHVEKGACRAKSRQYDFEQSAEEELDSDEKANVSIRFDVDY